MQNDGLPQKICNICQQDLDFCVRFIEKCETSNRKLKQELEDRKFTKSNSINNAYPPVKDESIEDTENLQINNDTNSYVCSKCLRNFPTKRSLSLHIGKKHGIRSHNCDLCDLCFMSKYSLLIHQDRKHNIKHQKQSKTIHQCHVCGRIFKYHAELARHISSHMGIKQFKCNQCNKAFVSKSALTRHLIKHNGIRQFECYLCPKSFTHPSNLQVHLKVHKNEKKYSCNICNKKFKANRTLLLHYKIHTNERDFPCNECDKAFINKYDLLRHLKLHEKKRQIEEGIYDSTKDEINKVKNMRQCEQCGKICSGAGDLKKHLRVHSGERPFGCLQCGKKFKSTSTLHCHERTHTQVSNRENEFRYNNKNSSNFSFNFRAVHLYVNIVDVVSLSHQICIPTKDFILVLGLMTVHFVTELLIVKET